MAIRTQKIFFYLLLLLVLFVRVPLMSAQTADSSTVSNTNSIESISNTFTRTLGEISQADDVSQNPSMRESQSNSSSDKEQISEVPSVPLEEDQFFLNSPDDTPAQTSAFGFWSTLRVLFVLVLLLSIGIGFIWLLKRLQTNQNSSNLQLINMVASRAISQGSKLHILKLGKSYLLIGDSGESVSLIKEYSDKEEIDEIELSISKADAESSIKESFLQKLQNAIAPSGKSISEQLGTGGVSEKASGTSLIASLFKKSKNKSQTGFKPSSHTSLMSLFSYPKKGGDK